MEHLLNGTLPNRTYDARTCAVRMAYGLVQWPEEGTAQRGGSVEERQQRERLEALGVIPLAPAEPVVSAESSKRS
ncbi:hypothetical protein GCM10027028_59830 [Streptomyces sundarbansensis]